MASKRISKVDKKEEQKRLVIASILLSKSLDELTIMEAFFFFNVFNLYI